MPNGCSWNKVNKRETLLFSKEAQPWQGTFGIEFAAVPSSLRSVHPRLKALAEPLIRECPLQTSERSGLFFAAAGFVLLSTGDAVIKTMAGMWAPTAIAALRYVFGAAGLVTLMLVVEGRGALAVPRPGLQWLRGAGVALATLCFFSALFVMQLAEATAIAFTSPILTALLAPIFLKERSRKETWIATFVAFAGVILILRPNFAELGLAALLPLGAALGMSVLFMANRASAGVASPLAMQAYIAVTAAPLLVLAAFTGWASGMEALAVEWPHWSVVARCAFVAITASCGHWLIYLGTTRAGAATIAPMTYTQLLVAVSLGWLLFGDTPDRVTWAGATIIVGAGLYLWRSGRVREPAMTD